MDWRGRETLILSTPEEGFTELQLEYLAALEKWGVALGNISDIKTERNF